METEHCLPLIPKACCLPATEIVIHMQSLDENQFWCHDPGPSLWALIVKHVPGSELPNICTALGHFLVDMYTEVHTEAEMWYSMWQDSQQSGYHSSREATSISSLPDPPVIKELLRAEVKMLLQSLEERASSRGGDGAELLLKYKPETVNYVLSHRNNFNSNGVNSENAADGSRPSSHCSFRSCAEEEIEAVRDKINVSDIDQVVDRLKVERAQRNNTNRLGLFFVFARNYTSTYLGEGLKKQAEAASRTKGLRSDFVINGYKTTPTISSTLS
ncbi:coiled-coil domain-containing protein 24 isoform X2 [Cynoglossus semilaevis]|uniref:coiled-coil domain-containing protein 24 isoform X2 n=1 Tax=Cynoglossus semilaevis TaxID=244447 RepID=UPI000D62D44C|nr:coiled-coil domain-containing protein 24 isoform X2 [Cynoglossus semilaevis]